MPSAVANKLLSSLSTESNHSLHVRGVAISLPVKFPFYDSMEAPRFGYFITSGLASIVTTIDKSTVEMTVVGSEGLVGGLSLLGPATGASSAFMQMEGTGIRVPIEDLQASFALRGEVYQRVLEHTQVQMLSVGTIAGCNVLHHSEARLARWLLTADDKTGAQDLPLTQEFVATMLGVRRTTVSLIASGLEEVGLIYSLRGRIKICDRAGLEKKACHCYQVLKRLNDRLYLNQAENTSALTSKGNGTRREYNYR